MLTQLITWPLLSQHIDLLNFLPSFGSLDGGGGVWNRESAISLIKEVTFKDKVEDQPSAL